MIEKSRIRPLLAETRESALEQVKRCYVPECIASLLKNTNQCDGVILNEKRISNIRGHICFMAGNKLSAHLSERTIQPLENMPYTLRRTDVLITIPAQTRKTPYKMLTECIVAIPENGSIESPQKVLLWFVE